MIMNDVWNLNTIYQAFDDPAFEVDFASAKEKIAQFAALTETLPAADPLEALRTGILLQEDIHALSQKLGMYASLRQYANSRDTAAQSQMGRLMGVFSSVAAPEATFQEWAAALPI
jgi:oligoendopeptidase F